MYSYFVVLLALFSAALGVTFEEFRETARTEIVDITAECADKVKATPEDLKEILAGKFPPTTASAKCVVACANKHFGIQTQDGKVNKGAKAALIERVNEVDPAKYKDLVSIWKACEDTPNDADECITGANLMGCIAEESRKRGFKRALDL